MPACRERRNGIPLLRSRTEPHLSVGGNPLTVQDHLDAAQLLIAEHRVKGVLIRENVQPLSLEVVQTVQVQLGGQHRRATERRHERETELAAHGVYARCRWPLKNQYLQCLAMRLSASSCCPERGAGLNPLCVARSARAARSSFPLVMRLPR